MFRLYYNVIVKQFGDRCKLLYSDTDSFYLWLKLDLIVDELLDIEQYFDFSSKSPLDPLYSTVCKAQMGLLKDELGLAQGQEVCAQSVRCSCCNPCP